MIVNEMYEKYMCKLVEYEFNRLNKECYNISNYLYNRVLNCDNKLNRKVYLEEFVKFNDMMNIYKRKSYIDYDIDFKFMKYDIKEINSIRDKYYLSLR